MKIHPTALIDSDAELAEDVEVGPHSIIESGARIAAGCKIGAQVHLMGDVTLGEETRVGTGAILGAEPQALDFDPATPSGVVIGRRNVVREYATIHRSLFEGQHTRVGDDNYLMNGAHLGHDVAMGDHNVVANNCLLGGHVEIGNRCFLGGGSVYHQFMRVGDLSMIQGLISMGQDMPPYTMAVGTNQIGGLNVVGLRRAGLDPESRRDIKRAFTLVYGKGLNLGQALEASNSMEWNEAARRFLDFFRADSRRGVCLNLHRHRRKGR